MKIQQRRQEAHEASFSWLLLAIALLWLLA